jgi:putative ABC transport system permease protein
MDIYAAQLMFGRGRTFDRIDLTIDSGVSVGAVKSAIQRELGPTFTVDPPSQRGQQFESLTRVYGAMANLTSLFALFIGMFIIYNTFAIAVSQRRKEIGILRALGATRRQIRHLFLAESAVTGSLGSLGGIGLGLVIAKLMAAGLSQFLGELYGVVQRADEIATDPLLLTGSFILGVITSVIAGWLPAQAAAGVDPVHALQKGKSQSVTQGEYRWRLRAALLCGLGSVPCLIWSGDKALFYLGYFLNILASLLLTPTLSSWLASALRPVLKSIRPVEGSLAADSLIQSPRRTSGTVAALMLSLAMVVSIGGLARSSYQAIVEWMDLALSPDLFVSPTENFAQRNFRFPAEIAGAIANVPGIADVQRVRMLRIPYRNSQVLLFSAEISSLMRHATLPPVEGEPRVMYPEAASGKACLISENFMNLYGVHKGDRVQLPAPQGMLELPVAGVVKDYSDQQGSILIDRSLMLRHWNDPSINVIRVYLRPGSSAAGVREDMLNRFGSASRLVVLTNQDLRAYILKVTDQWFGITYVQIAVAVLVALLGIVNSLIVSITDRRRELGVMTAVGALRMQIRATIWLEAVTIGFIGLILGLFWGAINLRYALEMSRQDMGGFGLAYVYPLGIALALIPGILAVAFLAGAGPAESAVRSSLVEALEYE